MTKVKTGFFEFNDITCSEAIETIDKMSGEKTQFHNVITPNVDHLSRLVNLDKKDLLWEIYGNASLMLCDSKILQVLMDKKGKKINNVVPGSTLTQELFDGDVLNGKNVLVIGSENDVFDKLKSKYPQINLAHINPSMGFINRPLEVEKIVHDTKELKPDFVFLAVGSPRQEILSWHLSRELNSGVSLCIGASILFLVGEEKRAPKIFQNLRLEWFYRMVTQKRLVKRYFLNFLALPKIYWFI